MRKRKISTLKEVAEKAGLSATAVSRALNGKPGVSEETVEMVKSIAKELNYKPNSIAQSLRLSSTKTIGVITSDSSHSFFAKVIKGIEDVAAASGYNIILSNSNSDLEKEKQAIEVLLNKRIDGLIIVSPMLTKDEDIKYLIDLEIPVVFLSRRHEKIDYVVTDNVQGARMITTHLIEKGRQKIHFINLPEDNISGMERLKGFKSALSENGIVFNSSLLYYCKPQVEEGYRVMSEILENQEEEVEAVFCGCDILAIGAMQAVYDKGLKVPDDIAIAGYDDIEFASYLRVPLTTISQAKYDMGSTGVEILLKKIRSKKEGRFQVTLAPELIIRESV